MTEELVMALSEEAKKYWKAFGVKVLENLASVKVWFFIFPFVISTGVLIWLVGSHIMFIQLMLSKVDNATMVAVVKEMKTITETFIAWCTFNVSLAGTIIVVRETFKVKKLTALNEEEKDNSEAIENMNA